MLSQRQADFRREYRSRIAGWYNGYFHVAVIYLMGGAALYYFTRRRHIESHLRATPEWVVETLRAVG